MKSNLWRRLLSLMAAAALTGSLGLVVAPAVVLAATDAGCTALGGNDASGTCVVSGAPSLAANVTVLEDLHLVASARVKITANGVVLQVGDATHPASLEMDKNTSIAGANKSFSINVPNPSLPVNGIVMHGTPPTVAQGPTYKCGYPVGATPIPFLPSNALGAQITSVPALVTTTITINVGNIQAIPPTGSFVMEPCSVVSVGSPQSAGQIVINAGHDVNIDGLVMSEGGMSGQSPNQPPGGGTITIKTSCELEVSPTGVVSSKGRDPGADLVHLEGCDVNINGLVQSTGSGHVVPHLGNTLLNHCDIHPHNINPGATVANGGLGSDTGCIEVWAEELTISSTGEVNADVNSTGSGGSTGTSYIDLFADKEISVTGKTGLSDKFAVHADSKSGTDVTPNTIAVLSHTSTITATGRAFSASSTGNGSWGGKVDIEASLKVTLDTANIQAFGSDGGGNTPSAPCLGGAGACGAGGHIIVTSFTDAISWQNGVGNVRPDVQGVTVPPGRSGDIRLTACLTIDTTGTAFGPNGLTSVYRFPGVCGVGPALPGYVEDAFAGPTGDRVIWEHCTPPGPGSKSGMKFNDANANHVKDLGEPGLSGWTIHIFNAGTSTDIPGSPQVTGIGGTYTFNAIDPGTYDACEDTQGPVWTQTFPTTVGPPVTVPPVGESLITCPNGSTGYRFTIVNSDTLTGNDFGNAMIAPPECPEDPNAHPTITVDSTIPNSATNFAFVSDAYTAAKLASGPQIIGIYTSSTENILIDTYPDAVTSMKITECGSQHIQGRNQDGAKETGADPTKAVWDITSTKKVTIVGPSVVGGNNIVGWLVESNGHELKSIRSDGVVVGIRVTGNNNQITGFNDVGTKTANTGNGIEVTGNGNTIKGNTVGGNGGIGVLITGNTNFLQATESNNGSDGVNVTGTGNTLKQNISSGNGGFQFNLAASATGTIDGGSNKANGQPVPGPTCPGFPAAGTQC